MLSLDTQDEKEINETLADNNKHDAKIEQRKHMSRVKNVDDDRTINKVVNTKACEQQDKCGDQTTRGPGRPCWILSNGCGTRCCHSFAYDFIELHLSAAAQWFAFARHGSWRGFYFRPRFCRGWKNACRRCHSLPAVQCTLQIPPSGALLGAVPNHD